MNDACRFCGEPEVFCECDPPPKPLVLLAVIALILVTAMAVLHGCARPPPLMACAQACRIDGGAR